MKGTIITGRAVITEDLNKAGIIKNDPPKKAYGARYLRQHRNKPKKK